MTDSTDGSANRSADSVERRRVWRIPPALPAVTLLVVTGLAALNIYGHPASSTRLVAISLAVFGFGTAVVWLRMYLVVDTEGVAVRRFVAESFTPWSDIDRVEVATGVRVLAGVSTANTIRVVRHDGSYVDVPPSLLQPAKPTGKRQATALLEQIAREIETFRVP